MTTLKQASGELRKLGLVLAHADGEYRVNFKGGAERSAYYTSDIEDALVTGRHMAAQAAGAILGSPSPAKLIDPATTREQYERAVAAEAVEYSASRFLGVGVYDTRHAPTLREACDLAATMGIERTLIYATNKAGRSVLVIAGGKVVRP